MISVYFAFVESASEDPSNRRATLRAVQPWLCLLKRHRNTKNSLVIQMPRHNLDSCWKAIATGPFFLASTSVLKLGPFQSSPVPSGPFAWSRSLLFKGFTD